MASTFTPNLNLQEPAAGDQVGTWGTLTVNPNMSALDLVGGGQATVSLNNSNVVLTGSQFQARMVTFNSTLTGSVIITFPTSFIKDYLVRNVCTGSSAFTVTLETTATGGQVVCCPPGQTVGVYNDGTNLFYTQGLPMVGEYVDYGGSSVPGWVSGCTIPPFLVCNGSSFSATTYPALATIFPGLVLPDARSKVRIPLDQGANINSSATTGLSSVGTTGGAQTVTLTANNLPASLPYTDPGHNHTLNGGPIAQTFGTGTGNNNGGGGGSFGVVTGNVTLNSATVGITINPGSPNTPTTNMQPSYIGGITLIRAA